MPRSSVKALGNRLCQDRQDFRLAVGWSCGPGGLGVASPMKRRIPAWRIAVTTMRVPSVTWGRRTNYTTASTPSDIAGEAAVPLAGLVR